MITNLRPTSNCVNLLLMEDVNLLDLDNVDSWLYALDFLPKERHDICLQVMSDEEFRACNIEHRVEVFIRK